MSLSEGKLEVFYYGDLCEGDDAAELAGWQVLLNPKRFAEFAFDFLVSWWHSRLWSVALVAFPAVFCMLITAVSILTYSQASTSWSAKRMYETTLSEAIANQNWAAARVACDGLLAKNPNELRYLFQRAVIAEGLQDSELARSLVIRCTPLDGIGYGPARLTTAKLLLSQKDVSTAKKQLELAVQESPLESLYAVELGRLMVASGEVERGLKTLEKAAGNDPTIRMQMGVFYQEHKQPADALRSFRLAATSANQSWESTGKAKFAVLVIEAWRSSGDLERAEQFARNWFQQDKNFRPAREALARCWAQQAEEFRQAGNSPSQWELLEKVLALSPNNIPALAQISELAFAKGDVAERANQTVTRMLSSGQAPTIVHTILGTRAAQANLWKKAAFHLDQAKEQNPAAPVILNNLAWVLANAEPPQLEQAKLISQEAIKLAPQHPDMYDTHGFVLLKLGDARGAITNFEKALKLHPNHLPYRRRLAEAYLAVGDSESARRLQSAIDAEQP